MAKTKSATKQKVTNSAIMENSNVALSLEQRFAQLEAQLKQQAEESAAKDAVIAAQDLQLAAANAQGAGSLSVITHDEKHYQVLAGKFSLDDKVITHSELKGNAELIALVVEKYPDLVQLIPAAPVAAKA
jgi:nitroreductase